MSWQHLLDDLRLIRIRLPFSIPFVRLTTGMQGRIEFLTCSIAFRNPSEGTPTMSTSALRTAASRSAVLRKRRGRVTSGR